MVSFKVPTPSPLPPAYLSLMGYSLFSPKTLVPLDHPLVNSENLKPTYPFYFSISLAFHHYPLLLHTTLHSTALFLNLDLPSNPWLFPKTQPPSSARSPPRTRLSTGFFALLLVPSDSASRVLTGSRLELRQGSKRVRRAP